MKTKRLFSLLLSFLFVLGCFTAPAGAIEASDAEAQLVIARATGKFEATISANTILPVGDSFTILPVGDSFILDSGDVASYDCTYTPRNANVKFGVIAPDGYFYGLSGSNGSINKGIRVEQRGTYTLAIWNKSDETVTVKGSVNY